MLESLPEYLDSYYQGVLKSIKHDLTITVENITNIGLDQTTAQMQLISGQLVRWGVKFQAVSELMGLCHRTPLPSIDELKQEFVNRKIPFPRDEPTTVREDVTLDQGIINLDYHLDL